MELIKRFPLWLLSGILYGLSWPIFKDINLSFLAWFAFVPLFIFLEKNKNNFSKSMVGCYLAMITFGCFSAGWLFNFPQAKLQIAVIFFLEELWIFIPFLIFYPIHKKIGFDKALWLFPFIWMLWEWMYLNLEFTMGTHLSAYSQSSNLWLIQFIDITGMWGISFWLLLFNVLLFKAYKSVNYNLKNFQFYKKVGLVLLLMLGIPLLYSATAFSKHKAIRGKNLKISLLPTQFSASSLLNQQNNISRIEQTLHRTDSIAFTMKDQNKYSDLYVWPETGIPFSMKDANLKTLFTAAVYDWEAALLTGGKEIPESYSKDDQRMYVSGILVSHQKREPLYHRKTKMTPGQEVIPYHSLLAKIPKFPIKETSPRFYKTGKGSKPLALTTSKKEKFLLGVSLCYEQWYPEHWTSLAKNGAELYVHLAGEGWYGNVGFMQFMANVSSMRSIENRRQTARCANVGLSGFIDQLGRFHHLSAIGSLQSVTTKVYTSNVVTWYAKYPNWFPLIGLVVLLISLLFQLYNQIFYKLLK